MKNDFIDLCEIPIDSKWALTYRATEHGFSFNDFHLKCTEQEKCLTIVKSEKGNVFGGYIDGAWYKRGKWMIDANAYLFSLINKESNPLKIKFSVPEKAAVGSMEDRIQSYGKPKLLEDGGYDLLLSESSNVNAFSYSDLGNIYVHPDYARGSNQAREFLA